MNKKYFHSLDILSLAIILWCFANVVWALVPDNLILDYKTIKASTPICVGGEQDFTGTREVLFDVEVTGIDKVLDLDTNIHDYRWSWKSIYFKDNPIGEWKAIPRLDAGRYKWEAYIQVHVPLMLPKTIDPVFSNEFEVVDCNN